MGSWRKLRLVALALLSGCSGSPTPGGSCQSTRNCVSGEVCVGGTCTPSKLGCKNDLECEVGQWCDPSDRKCKAILDDGGIGNPSDGGPNNDGGGLCTRDDECGSPPADVCVANQCVKGCNEPDGLTCTGGTQCDPASGHCISVNPDCTLDAECVPGPPTQICINQQCVAGCGANPNLCIAGSEVCDTNTGRCVPAPMPCADDNACNPPATVCESMQCVPGCGAQGGIQCVSPTPMCDPASGRCTPAGGCTLDSQCTPPDEICVNSACVVRCDRPNGIACGADVCNPNDGRCVPGNLPLGDQTCMLDAQCQSGACLALTISMMNVQVCSRACGATSQCPLDYTCLAVSGMSFCLGENLFVPAATFDTPSGGTCNMTVNTCQSFWCNTGISQCMESCSRNLDCTNFGGNCSMYTYDNMGTPGFEHLCFQQGGAGATGASCAANTGCQSGICNRYESLCAQHCCADSDCPANQSCAIYDADPNNIVKICRARGGAGAGALGANCTMPTDCESEVCAAVNPADPNSARKCSTLCCQDGDCAILPLGGRCQPIATPLPNLIIGACTPN